MIIDKLKLKGLINCPKWLPNNIHYLTIMGSEAYGVSSGDSDRDVYGVCIPPKEIVFPHVAGYIDGFGEQRERFDVWQQHHINDDKYQYDFSVYSIVRYFHLCMENNPNMIDSLFTPRRCVLFISPAFEVVRQNRRTFLHKGCFHKLKGYAYSQLHRIKERKPSNEKRAETVEKFGYDTKYAYHLIRLLNECEQILMTGDLDLEQNREMLKSIRRGEWTLQRVEDYMIEKEKSLDLLYVSSTLRNTPDIPAIKQLLLDTLESHYGSLKTEVITERPLSSLLYDLDTLIAKYR